MDQPQICPALLQSQSAVVIPVPEEVEDQLLLGIRSWGPGLGSLIEMSSGPAEGRLMGRFHISKIAAEEMFASPESFWSEWAKEIPEMSARCFWPVALSGANGSFRGLAEKTPTKIDMREQSPDLALTWRPEYEHIVQAFACYQCPPGSVRVRIHRGSSVTVMGTKCGGADVVWRFGISTQVDDPSACILYTNVEVGAGKEGWKVI